MDQGPLVTEQIAAADRFLTQLREYVPVQAAFWGKDSEDGRWDLYVASDQIDDKNFDLVYGEVIRISGVMKDPNFDPFQVKLIKFCDPMAQAAMDIHRRYPGRAVARFNGGAFGRSGVIDVYIYPSPAAVGGT